MNDSRLLKLIRFKLKSLATHSGILLIFAPMGLCKLNIKSISCTFVRLPLTLQTHNDDSYDLSVDKYRRIDHCTTMLICDWWSIRPTARYVDARCTLCHHPHAHVRQR
jgi:hypothetical protein